MSNLHESMKALGESSDEERVSAQRSATLRLRVGFACDMEIYSFLGFWGADPVESHENNMLQIFPVM
uniref:Uncharacterized protein n=1 Tax=Physcomitrium patens TaxID=3218 RepID=A0A2K1K222_PHYPA|nr:hypothetical protein PHYPA_012298 [Physcomitrium patens]